MFSTTQHDPGLDEHDADETVGASSGHGQSANSGTLLVLCLQIGRQLSLDPPNHIPELLSPVWTAPWVVWA